MKSILSENGFFFFYQEFPTQILLFFLDSYFRIFAN